MMVMMQVVPMLYLHFTLDPMLDISWLGYPGRCYDLRQFQRHGNIRHATTVPDS